jgi:hypothetical protein
MLRTGPRTATFVTHAVGRTLGMARRYPEIPTRWVTPGLVASVWLDEFAVAALPTIPLPEVPLAQVRDETDATLAVLETRGWLRDPRGFHHTPPPPAAPRLVRRQFGWIRYEHMTFPSEFEPWSGLGGRDRWLAVVPNRVAHAFVMRHRTGPRRWVVNLHGYSAGAPADLIVFRSLRLHRDLGFNVLHVVAPLHGPRRAPDRRSGDGIISFDYPRNLHAFTHAVWDVRRCVAWAREQGASSIAVHGMSLGGFTAALLAGIADDIDEVIAGIPAADISWAMTRNVPGHATRELDRHGLLGPSRDAIHRMIAPLAVPCLVPAEARHIYSGVGDRMTTPGQAYALWNHWDRPNVCWYGGSHCGAGWSREVHRFVDAALLAR